MDTLKIFSNWLKTRADNVGVIRKKGGGEGDVDVGMEKWYNSLYWFILLALVIFKGFLF